jgi:hypothetical protein
MSCEGAASKRHKYDGGSPQVMNIQQPQLHAESVGGCTAQTQP